MNIDRLREWATEKEKFQTVEDFITFGRAFIDYRIEVGFQAELVSRNTPQYRFLQFGADAEYQLTRPINTQLFYAPNEFDQGTDPLLRDHISGIDKFFAEDLPAFVREAPPVDVQIDESAPAPFDSGE
jgi:hypothetical protein